MNLITLKKINLILFSLLIIKSNLFKLFNIS